VETTFEADAEGLAPLATAVLEDLRDTIVGFAEPKPEAAPALARPPAAIGSTGGFFRPDAFTNQEHVQHALKTTAAAMFCYCLYVLLDWQQIHTCFITCYIVALNTAAEAVEKLVLRMLGCLLGAAAGIAAIVFVLPSLTSVGGLMAVVFAGAFASAWVGVGSPRIAYAGFQIAFAFFLCMLQGPTPEFDMSIARDRVIGVLIGDIVSYLVFTRVWPVSVTKSVDPAISAVLGRLGAMTTTVGLSARRAIAAEVLASRDAIETNLELAGYEPRSTRPPPGWQRRRLEAVRAILALTGPLLLSADRLPEVSMEFGRRLRAAAPATSSARPWATATTDQALAPDVDEPPRRAAETEAAAAADRAEANAVRGLLDRDYRRLELAMAERHAPV
jgi:multidrug resistance protein MdtO